MVPFLVSQSLATRLCRTNYKHSDKEKLRDFVILILTKI